MSFLCVVHLGLWWFVLLLGFGLFTACFGFVLKFFCGEFDPGSGRTLAACLTHAAQTPTGGSSGEYCTMGASLMQRRRVGDDGLRVVNSFR